MFEKILSLLKQSSSSGQFCTQVSKSFDDLKLVVDPNGPLEFPLSETTAKALIRYAQPAQFGLGEKTLFDPRVRNVWEIRADRLQIDEASWGPLLKSVLGRVQHDLNLPAKGHLSAHLHNLLIYEPGQFFLGHQDSEKIDGMLGTLVVLLPSFFEGGALVIDQHGDQQIFPAPTKLLRELTFIAFYSDCVHEVKPVTSGYRVALTYNLVFESPSEAIAPRSNKDLTSELGRYFFDPSQASTRTEGQRPPWFVYLLDHEYSERGLSWNGLKGVDRFRAEELLGSAENLGLTAHLALGDIHQIWSTESDAPWGRYGRRRYRYHNDDDDDEDADEDLKAYRLTELIEDECVLHHWINPKGQRAEMGKCGIQQDLMCWTKSVDEYKPFKSEYESYTGNAGNTLDRWYHRAAIVLWAAESNFASLGFVDMSWTLKTIGQILSQNLTEGQLALKQILPHWRSIDPSYFLYSSDKQLSSTVVKNAIAAMEPELAEALLSPLGMRTILHTPESDLLSFAESYGESWFLQQMQNWQVRQHKYNVVELDNLVRLVEVFSKHFRKIANWIWEYQCSLIVARDIECAAHDTPKTIKQDLVKRMRRIEVQLYAAQTMDDPQLSNRVVDQLLSYPKLYLTVELAQLIPRLMKNQDRSSLALWGIDRLLAETKARLMKQAAIRREDDNWSILEKVACNCVECEKLKIFLAACRQQKIVWPLAKDRRQHIHEILESMDIPVSHVTQHTGSPHKLVLTKSPELFQISGERARSASELLVFLEKIKGVNK